MSFGQGGPFDGPGGTTPDWDALAEESEARARRKRWMYIGGGALATVAVAGIVAAAVMTSGSDPKGGSASAPPSASGLTEEPDDKPSFPDVSVPPPPNPRDYISDPAKDKAPLTPATLFPQKKMIVGENTYARAKTSSTKDCTAAAQGALGSLLSHNGCSQLLRATYSKGGMAVTVGIAVFDSPAKAERVKNQSKPNLAPLAGDGIPASFCQGTKCLMNTNATGRYAYFTIAGFTNGKPVTGSEAQARRIGGDAAGYAFNQITQRGKDQATQAAREQAKEAQERAQKQS
ncbi:hypothetical protein QOM21_20340 [Streptomyces sp. Pv4-95]|uniref:hypothetical protein n=1 Tax=Streptomyces sp. Pv4-95 TaxID=3049543 RepID=UPI0038923749